MRPLRFAIYGPENSGKSTLVQQLAQHFGEPWAPEFVRDFWHAQDGDIRAEHLATIARGQMANEERAAAEARRLMLCDTELITNTLWADLLFPGHCPPWVRQAADQRSRHYALYLLCDNRIPFADDPVRSFPDEENRRRCRRLWRAALASRDLPYVDIRGTPEQRLATAVSAIQAQLRHNGRSPQS